MSEIEAIANAVTQSAKLGEVSIEASQKVGGFFAAVFKEPSMEIAGMITDKLRFVRWKRLVDMADEVNEIHKSRGVNDTHAVPPKLALPIFEEASLENDPSLQSLWSHLLANAMDANFQDEIRYAYTEIIKNLTALDATLLRSVYKSAKREYFLTLQSALRCGVRKELIRNSISETDYLVSANNLIRLRVIASFTVKVSLEGMGGIRAQISSGESLTIDKGTDMVCMTPLGIQFIEACS